MQSPEYSALRRNAEYESMNERLIERVPAGCEAVVDIGCGDGAVSEMLLEALPDASLVGVDPSHTLIEEAGARLGDRARFLVGDAAAVSRLLPAGSRDLAVLANCIHLVEDLPEALASIGAVLRPGGRLLVSSAFYSGAESAGDLALYADLIATARSRARGEGLVPQRSPAGRPRSLRRTAADYEAALTAAGFGEVRCTEVEFTLGRSFLTALCATPMFASAALAGVERTQAARLLTESLETLGDPVRITRRCAYLTAVRP